MAVSFQCMTKSTTIKKIKNKKLEVWVQFSSGAQRFIIKRIHKIFWVTIALLEQWLHYIFE